MKFQGTPIRRRKKRLEYDPNSRDAPQWATYIPSRSPAWKVHAKKGQAAGAVSNSINSSGYGHPAILYEFHNGRWVERGRAEPVEFCAHCGEDAKAKHDYYTRLSSRKGQYQFEKPFVCRTCYDMHFGHNAIKPVDPKLVQVPK